MPFLFITNYLAETLTNDVPSLATFRYLSLFYYFDSSAEVFTKGVKAGDVLILLGLAAFFFILAVLGFQRRNVTMEAWPRQRAKMSNTRYRSYGKNPIRNLTNSPFTGRIRHWFGIT
jgi:hypothetical protein